MTEPTRSHPKNVDGPFYVEYGCCTACDLPRQEAPNLFAYDGDDHCYICRQPGNLAETTDMIGIAWAAELRCIRYRGNDADVLRRFAELDLRELCDIEPPQHIKPIVRNHVEFEWVGSVLNYTSEHLAGEFVEYLQSENKDRLRYKTRHIRATVESVSLEFSWYADRYHTVEFADASSDMDKWHIHFPITNDSETRGVGNVLASWLSQSSDRFRNVRWYTHDDWIGMKIGQSTRY